MQNPPGGSGRQYVRGSGLGVPPQNTRHSSMPGIAEGTPSAVRSSFSKKRLDPSDPSTWTSSHKPSFSERTRAASETIPRAEVPSIHLQNDADKAQANRGVEVNRDGSSVAQDQKSSPTAASLQSAAPPPESQKSPATSNADPVSPFSSPKDNALAVPKDDSPENRRLSNQSASFSSMTTDSDRIGRTSFDDDGDNEHVLQETSDESSSSSGSSDERDEDNESLTGARGRKRKSDRASKSPTRRAEESPKEPASPVIRGWYYPSMNFF